jgi:hypothetical protein
MTRHDDGRRPATELDRLLGEWLADGPRRAPEAPVSLAIDFARSHPRRTDPLRAFRRDPMAGRGGALFVLQPVFALLTLGLLVAALGAVAVAGGLVRVGPAPIPVPAPSAPVVPVPSVPAEPVPAAPTPGPPGTSGHFEVTLATDFATHDSVTFDDFALRVTSIKDVSTTSRGEPGAQDGMPGVTQVDDRTIDLLWVAWPCTNPHWGFVLDETATTLEFTPPPPCGGDTVAVTRAIRVHFDGPVDAASIKVVEP